MRPLAPTLLLAACLAAAPPLAAQGPSAHPDSLVRVPVFPDIPPAEALAYLEGEAAGLDAPYLHGAWSAIAATADSVTYFRPIRDLAFAFAGRGDARRAASALYTLRSLGARRPYLRSLALAPFDSPVLAGAATRVLADDPRVEEEREISALAREVFASRLPDGQTFLSAANEYGVKLWLTETYDAMGDLEGRVTFLIEAGRQGWFQSRLRELYLSNPAGVRAVIEAYAPSVPEDAPPPTSHPLPPEWMQQDLLEIASAPASIVPPTLIEGPLSVLCHGIEPTVYVSVDGRIVGGELDGQPYAGTLRGSYLPDVIIGTDGDDVLFGGAGDDVLCGGSGDDTLWGGSQDDTLDGGPGRDVLHGESGVDELLGGPGDDELFGESQDDRLDGGDGNDLLDGADGADDLQGGPGDDILIGRSQNDRLDGGDGDDELDGGSGDDTLIGGPGTDTADGSWNVDACDAETERNCETDPPADN